MEKNPFLVSGRIRGLALVVLVANLASAQLPKADPPVFDPPGGVFVRELEIHLTTKTPRATILYRHSQYAPDTVERGSTFSYGRGILIGGFDTSIFSARTVAPGYAPSDVVTEVYIKDKVTRVMSASYTDMQGDGIIERVIVFFSIDLPELPKQLDFRMRDRDGRFIERSARADRGEIRYYSDNYRNGIVIDLLEPFPFGLTSQPKTDSLGHTHAQADIPLTEFDFPVAESAPPLILDAKVLERGPGNPRTIVYATFSEPVRFRNDDWGAPISFRRDGKAIPMEQVRMASRGQVGERTIAFSLDSTAKYQAQAGDSVAIGENGQIQDLGGAFPFRGQQRFVLLAKTLTASLRRQERKPPPHISVRDGRLRGWSFGPAPMAIECYALNGFSLGAAHPLDSRKAWILPTAGSMLVKVEMPDGSSWPYFVRPGGSSERALPRK